MRLLLSFLACLSLSEPTIAATTATADCVQKLSGQWIPTFEEHQRIVLRVLRESGDGKPFGGLYRGQHGTRIFLIPHGRVGRVLDVAARFNGGESVEKLRHAPYYEPDGKILAGILETTEHPTLTLAVFSRDFGPTLASSRLDPVVLDEDELRRLVPDAFGEVFAYPEHLLWEILRDDIQIGVPGQKPWSIAEFRHLNLEPDPTYESSFPHLPRLNPRPGRRRTYFGRR